MEWGVGWEDLKGRKGPMILERYAVVEFDKAQVFDIVTFRLCCKILYT
jgi:hypothetical protein